MQKIYILLMIYLLGNSLVAQTNFVFTHPAAETVLLGNYNAADYAASNIIDDPALIANELSERISPDSLKSYIIALSLFGNRNSGSDTVSQVRGIGAARRWTYEKFRSFGVANENRLLPGYFQFDREMCSVTRHRNIIAVLPGSDPDPNGVLIIEGHIDSRCAVLCDTACVAQGVEDNATGTALVIELARVMSRYTFKNTIVFMVVIGEEQGLYGADAFAAYAKSKEMPIRAVLNNDVIGGVICGKTSSPPSCSGYNDIDSTSVRLFSAGGYNSPHKQLARYIKLEYRENLAATAAVPMNVRIMTPEDRTGRGGDHIPFRQRSYASMRFTAANEHGDASNGPTYDDRQHTSDDILGVDTNNDNEVDSFFVQFNYLSRNALINGNAAAMIARAVPVPTDFTGYRLDATVTVSFTDTANLGVYRVALRSTTNDWDTVYTLTGATSGTFPCNPGGSVFVSIAGVDAQGVESLFSTEKIMATTGTDDQLATNEESRNIRLFQNRPNPFDEATWISFWINELPRYQKATILITDMGGRTVMEMPVALQTGMNEVLYVHGYGGKGAFQYTLLIDNQPVDSKKMVFAN